MLRLLLFPFALSGCSDPPQFSMMDTSAIYHDAAADVSLRSFHERLPSIYIETPICSAGTHDRTMRQS
jgi:hypothetical protein